MNNITSNPDLESELDHLLGMAKDDATLYKQFPGFISHIRLPNFKNIARNTKIDFKFPITALVGCNGCGKTSVLISLYGAPSNYSVRDYWFNTPIDPIAPKQDDPPRIIYGHYNTAIQCIVETRKARVRKKTRTKTKRRKFDPDFWEPTKESSGDEMTIYDDKEYSKIIGRKSNRWLPVQRDVLFIIFKKELSAFDKYFYFHNTTDDGYKREHILRGARNLKRLLKLSEDQAKKTTYYTKPVCSENRKLTNEEVHFINFILEKNYTSAFIAKHGYYGKGRENNLSVMFEVAGTKYSEAFAGSGEVAVTSCVIQVLNAKNGTLILLDEPETSLHPGAQKRLLAFLAIQAKTKKHQIIFSTHSTHLIENLPDIAIKSFIQNESDRYFHVNNATPSYTAFDQLGASIDGHMITIFVEDSLSQCIVEQALLLAKDNGEKLAKFFTIISVSGGAAGILKYKIPAWMHYGDKIYVLLDGDQKTNTEFLDPEKLTSDTFDAQIKRQVGVLPSLNPDGNNGLSQNESKINLQKKYLKWIKTHLFYLPLNRPEEIILKVLGEKDWKVDSKKKLKNLAQDFNIKEVSNKDITEYSKYKLAENRGKSDELKVILKMLKNILNSHKQFKI